MKLFDKEKLCKGFRVDEKTLSKAKKKSVNSEKTSRFVRTKEGPLFPLLARHISKMKVMQ